MEILFNIEELICDGVLTEREGEELLQKTKDVATSTGLRFEDKKRVTSSLHEFIVLVNQMNTKEKLSSEERHSLINPANNIINQLA